MADVNPFAKYAAEEENPFSKYQTGAAKPAFDLKGEGWDKLQNYSGRDAIGGAIRGAGSIGASFMRILPNALGGDTAEENQQRRTAMDGGLKELIGSNPDSMSYKTLKLGAEVAGTMGAGGGIASMAARIPGLAAAAPNVINAIRTSGMTAGATPGIANMLTRIGGGAITGGVSAGMVNPEDAGVGALVGGAFPVAAKLAGEAGGAIGRAFKPADINPIKLQSARESMDAGYIIPPSMVQPSFGNRVMESFSGKHATAQMAATQNQAVTEGLVRKGLGLPAEAPLTFESMQGYRAAQHKAGYEPLRNIGDIPAGPAFNDALDAITKQYTGKGTIPAIEKSDITNLVNAHKTNGFDSGDAVDAIRILRENANEAFRKGDNALGKASKSIANAYEGAIDNALESTGQNNLLTAYREARQNIAKSATVEKAIREGSGTLDARILGRELQKGKPLSGDIKTVAQFGNVFDKAAQPPHLIGSPAVNNLTAMLTTGTGATGASIGAHLGGPAGAAVGGALGASYPFVVPPLLRARMFSQGAQKSLLNQAGPGSGLLGSAIDQSLPSMYRINGLLSSEINRP